MFRFLPRPVFHPEPAGGAQPPPGGNAPPPPSGGAPGLLDAPPEGGKEPPPPPNSLPETWRDIMAGGDADLLTELQRYPTYTDAAKNLLALKKQVRSGSVQSEPMPDIGDGKDPAKVEALKAWRAARGVPEVSTGYQLGDKDSLKERFSDADKPALDSVFEWAHSKGKSQAEINDFLGWYADYAGQSEEMLSQNDAKDFQTGEDELRSTWGVDYTKNLGMARKVATELFGGAEDVQKFGGSILEARLPNGTMLKNLPGFVRGLVEAGLAKFGDGAFVGEEAVKATESRKAELERAAATDYNEYVQSGKQKEYRTILDAEEKAGKLRR